MDFAMRCGCRNDLCEDCILARGLCAWKRRENLAKLLLLQMQVISGFLSRLKQIDRCYSCCSRAAILHGPTNFFSNLLVDMLVLNWPSIRPVAVLDLASRGQS